MTARLPSLSTRRILAALRKAGFEDAPRRGKGSRLFDEESQLLLGDEPGLTFVWVSPDGKWIASEGSEGDLHLWPMPDLAAPPLHTLPHEELMARLEALTNLRAVPDDSSSTGYRIEPDFSAYRGWTEVPQW